jgi:hypothetical protein
MFADAAAIPTSHSQQRREAMKEWDLPKALQKVVRFRQPAPK